MAVKKIPKSMKFEDALSELEQQVRLLESGELSLEESLEVFKYGVELGRLCSGKLEAARQEVEKIVPADGGSSYGLEPFGDLEEK